MKPFLLTAALIAVASPGLASDLYLSSVAFVPDVTLHGLSDYVVRAVVAGPYGLGY